MAPRPYWKGYLKLSLVSCPIALYTATTTSERVAFRQINKKTGNRLRQQLVDDVTREPVEAEDKGRGYEVAKNTYMVVDDDELDAVAIESNHTIEIDSFVPRASIDERYFESPYYIAPTDEVGQEAFAVIRDAMRGKDMVALARVVLSKRERVIMLQPWDKGLMGTTLRYPYELREAGPYFEDIPDIKTKGEMLELAEHILESKEAEFDPSKFVDHYEEAVIDMLRQKQAGMPTPKEKAPAPAGNVINLMDALRRSLGDSKKAAAKPPAKEPAKAAGKKKTAAAKEEEARRSPQFKLPIKGGKEQPAKRAAAPASTTAAKPAMRRKSA
jgi:DNA end-binding protein Ku